MCVAWDVVALLRGYLERSLTPRVFFVTPDVQKGGKDHDSIGK